MTAPPRQHRDDAALIELSRLEPEVFTSLYYRHAAPIHRYVALAVTSDGGPGNALESVSLTNLATVPAGSRYIQGLRVRG
jgi:hypothetical protein